MGRTRQDLRRSSDRDKLSSQLQCFVSWTFLYARLVTDRNISKNQYVSHFKKWGWRKNITAPEWRLIDKALATRKEAGRESEVYFNGFRVPDVKVKKEISRNVTLSSKFTSCKSRTIYMMDGLTRKTTVPITHPPEDIQIRTPPPLICESSAAVDPFVLAQTSSLAQTRRKQSPQYEVQSKFPKTQRNLYTCPPTNLLLSTFDLPRQSSQQPLSCMGQPPGAAQNLPYFEFLDLFRSLNLGEQFPQGYKHILTHGRRNPAPRQIH